MILLTDRQTDRKKDRVKGGDNIFIFVHRKRQQTDVDIEARTLTT